MLVGDLPELRQPGDVPLHRVNALDHEHLRRVGANRGEDFAQVVRAVMREPLDRRHGQPDAVPQARVDVFVREDDVALLRKRRDAREAGKITRDMNMTGFASEQSGEFLLELDVIRT